MEIFEINSNSIKLSDIKHIINDDVHLKLSEEAVNAVQKCRD